MGSTFHLNHIPDSICGGIARDHADDATRASNGLLIPKEAFQSSSLFVLGNNFMWLSLVGSAAENHGRIICGMSCDPQSLALESLAASRLINPYLGGLRPFWETEFYVVYRLFRTSE